MYDKCIWVIVVCNWRWSLWEGSFNRGTTVLEECNVLLACCKVYTPGRAAPPLLFSNWCKNISH